MFIIWWRELLRHLLKEPLTITVRRQQQRLWGHRWLTRLDEEHSARWWSLIRLDRHCSDPRKKPPHHLLVLGNGDYHSSPIKETKSTLHWIIFIYETLRLPEQFSSQTKRQLLMMVLLSEWNFHSLADRKNYIPASVQLSALIESSHHFTIQGHVVGNLHIS